MRAREFTINIPINVRIDGDEVSSITSLPQVDTAAKPVTGLTPVTIAGSEPKAPKLKPVIDNNDDVDVAPNFNKNPDREQEEEKELGVFTPPLQQKIELLKKNTGVDSEFDHEDSNNGSST